MFVSIQKAEGSTITVVQDAQQGRGGRRGGGGAGGQNPGRGRRGGAVAQPKMEYQVAQNVKVTGAMRERRTQELLVGVELSGGLRNPIFQKMQQPLSARLLFTRNQATEINVITPGGDINQTVSSSDGVPDIADLWDRQYCEDLMRSYLVVPRSPIAKETLGDDDLWQYSRFVLHDPTTGNLCNIFCAGGEKPYMKNDRVYLAGMYFGGKKTKLEKFNGESHR